MWRTSAEANTPTYSQPTFKKSVPVLFWGCIGPNGVGRLVVCDTSSYIAALQNNLLQSTEKLLGEEGKHFIFQQDNAISYRANTAKNFVREQGTIDVLSWPRQSLDLSINENVQLYMKNTLNFDSRGAPKTQYEMIT